MSKATITLGEDDNGNEVVMTTRLPMGTLASEMETAAFGLKHLYDSLLSAGFTKTQAMEMIMTVLGCAKT